MLSGQSATFNLEQVISARPTKSEEKASFCDKEEEDFKIEDESDESTDFSESKTTRLSE